MNESSHMLATDKLIITQAMIDVMYEHEDSVIPYLELRASSASALIEPLRRELYRVRARIYPMVKARLSRKRARRQHRAAFRRRKRGLA